MRRAAVGLLLFACLEAATVNAEESDGPGLVVSVVGATLSGDNCHLSFQVRNRLLSDLQRFAAEFTARSAAGAELGRGVFAAGRIRRLQPFLRAAAFEVPPDEPAACGLVASVELDIQSCVLAGTGDVGPAYCRTALRGGPESGDGIQVHLAGRVPDGPAEELTVNSLGVTFSTLTQALAAAHGIPGTVAGVVVVGVPQPAAVRGLQEGDLVIEVDQERVPTLAGLTERVDLARAAGQASVLCMVFRDGQRHWLVAPFLAEAGAAAPDSPG